MAIKKKRRNRKEQLVYNYFSELGKKSAEKRRQKYGENYMRDLSLKAAAKAKARKAVVNEDDPSKNCQVCGFDHAAMTPDNRETYFKAHQESLRKIAGKDHDNPRGI